MTKPSSKDIEYNIAREQVIILTEREVIEGILCYHKGTRLSDALNAPAAQRDRANIPLVDAVVTNLETGQEILRARFLLVARSKISILLPKSEVLGFQLGYPAAPPHAFAGEEQPVLPRAAAGPAGAFPAHVDESVPVSRSGTAETRENMEDDKSTLPALIEALRHKDALVRRGAVMALANFGPEAKSAVPALVHALSDPDELIRRQSLVALSNIGPDAKAAVPAILVAMTDEDELVRRQAVVTLGNIGPDAREAVPALIEALRDESEFVRGRAADALSRIGPDAEAAIPALKEALEDEDMLVRHWASIALEKIQGVAEIPRS